MADSLNVHQRLLAVQTAVKVPKEKREGARFASRNAEDILDATRDACLANRLLIDTDPELVFAHDRLWVRVTATATNVDDPSQVIERHGLAEYGPRERGMSAEQVTGAVDSYARKYALQHLLKVGGGYDADSPEVGAASQNAADPETGELPTCPVCKKPLALADPRVRNRDAASESKWVHTHCVKAQESNGHKASAVEGAANSPPVETAAPESGSATGSGAAPTAEELEAEAMAKGVTPGDLKALCRSCSGNRTGETDELSDEERTKVSDAIGDVKKARARR